MRCRLIAIGVLGILFGALAPVDVFVPAVSATPTELTDSYVYPYLYELRLRNPGCPILVTDRPYVRMDLAGWLAECTDRDSLPDARSRWLHGMLERDLAGETGLLNKTYVEHPGARALVLCEESLCGD